MSEGTVGLWVHLQVAHHPALAALASWWNDSGSVGSAWPGTRDLFLLPYSWSVQESADMTKLPLLMAVLCLWVINLTTNYRGTFTKDFECRQKENINFNKTKNYK